MPATILLTIMVLRLIQRAFVYVTAAQYIQSEQRAFALNGHMH